MRYYVLGGVVVAVAGLVAVAALALGVVWVVRRLLGG
jgi:hypothetical protein